MRPAAHLPAAGHPDGSPSPQRDSGWSLRGTLRTHHRRGRGLSSVVDGTHERRPADPRPPACPAGFPTCHSQPCCGRRRRQVVSDLRRPGSILPDHRRPVQHVLSRIRRRGGHQPHQQPLSIGQHIHHRHARLVRAGVAGRRVLLGRRLAGQEGHDALFVEGPPTDARLPVPTRPLSRPQPTCLVHGAGGDALATFWTARRITPLPDRERLRSGSSRRRPARTARLGSHRQHRQGERRLRRLRGTTRFRL